jgi:hypothetical protein
MSGNEQMPSIEDLMNMDGGASTEEIKAAPAADEVIPGLPKGISTQLPPPPPPTTVKTMSSEEYEKLTEEQNNVANSLLE